MLSMKRMTIYTGLVVAAVSALCAAMPAGAQDSESAATADQSNPAGVYAVRDLDPQMQNIWKRSWAPIARKCAKWEGRYYVLPTYDRRYANSLGKTLQEAIRDKQRTVVRRGAGVITRRTVDPEKEEAEAIAYLLPDIVVGHYGYIQSAEIEMIIDEKTMIVSHIKLVDEEKLGREYADLQRELRDRYRESNRSNDVEDYLESRYEERKRLAKLQESERFEAPMIVKGFDTFGLAKGMAWKAKAEPGKDDHGIHIAIVDMQEYDRGRQKDTFAVAIPMSAFAKPLDDEREFIAMLKEIELGLDVFCDKLLMHKKNNPQDADALMFRELLDYRPDLAPMIDPRVREEREEEAAREAERARERAQRERERAERDAERERRRQERERD